MANEVMNMGSDYLFCYPPSHSSDLFHGQLPCDFTVVLPFMLKSPPIDHRIQWPIYIKNPFSRCFFLPYHCSLPSFSRQQHEKFGQDSLPRRKTDDILNSRSENNVTREYIMMTKLVVCKSTYLVDSNAILD